VGNVINCGSIIILEVSGASCSKAEAFVPNPRMNCVLTYKQNTVYMYGGMYETGDKQVRVVCYSLKM